jgi:NADH dehydrogenase
MEAKKKIVIIGAGFAGIELVKSLGSKMFDILLLDKLNHHQFQPLFYQVATSQLEPSSISFPLRKIFHDYPNVQIRLAEVTGISPEKNTIATSIGSFSYDYLVMAIGCKTNYFGNVNLMEHAYSLKSTYDAITIRNHVLETFEKIVSATPEERESLLNLVIVGAGPTGVELAGAFAEIKKNVLAKDYPGVDFSGFRILLLEGSKNTLNNMSDHAKAASRTYLQKLGVTILTETIVKEYDGTNLTLKDGSTIKTKTVIWAAGVTGNSIPGLPESCVVAGSRLKVDRTNRILGATNIFAVGDIAYMETEKYPRGHPQVANVAINQAKNLGKNLANTLKNKPERIFEYKDLGTMATVGKNKAVVDLPFVRFKGYFAWLTWMFLHLMLILSVRNKLIVFINWAWSYIFGDTSLGIILKKNGPSQSK